MTDQQINDMNQRIREADFSADDLLKILESPFSEQLFRTLAHKRLSATLLPNPMPARDMPVGQSCMLIGQIANTGRNVGLFIMRVDGSVARRPAGLRRLTAGLISTRCQAQLFDSALVAYVGSEGAEWRLSFITNIDGKATAPRRFSFVLGRPGTCRTATERLWSVMQKKSASFDSLLEAFSVENLTKEFYAEISDWYAFAMDRASFPNDLRVMTDDQAHNAESLVRLVTRMMFVWFLKEKGLVPEMLFDKKWLTEHINAGILQTDTTAVYHPGLDKCADNRRGSLYYRLVLQNLFFATLNCPIEARGFTEPAGFKGIRPTYSVNLLYRYREDLKDVQAFLDVMKRVPFVNGGLFDCLDHKTDDTQMYPDGFSERTKSREQLHIPDGLFFGEHTGAGNKTVYGLVDILQRYHFTVEENTPMDQDVSLDPELLGSVFENLLAAYNPETKKTARANSGSFYTPRSIVDYMVRESLVEALALKVDKTITEDDLRLLFDAGTEETPDGLKGHEEEIIKHIYALKILDPACGSGAFPMGVLQMMVHALGLLDPDNKRWRKIIEEKSKKDIEKLSKEYDDNLNQLNDELKERQESLSKLKINIDLDAKAKVDSIEPLKKQLAEAKECMEAIDKKDHLKWLMAKQKLEDITEKLKNASKGTSLSPIDTLANSIKERQLNYDKVKLENDDKKKALKEELAKRLAKIEADFAQSNIESNYLRKLYIIERQIFGSDIQPIAIQITKLRCFITLTADQRVTKPEDFKTLPNIDIHFVAADSLGKVKTASAGNAFDEIYKEAAGKLKDTGRQLFYATQKKAKKKLQDGYTEQYREFTDRMHDAGIVDQAGRDNLLKWYPFDQNLHAPFFNPEIMFGLKDGFDIVIGNPPYVQIKKGIYSVEDYPYAEGKDPGKQNLYKMFVELGYNMAKPDGVVCLIVQSSLMCDMSASATRELLMTKTRMKCCIEFPKKAPTPAGQVFKNVLQGTCIVLFVKDIPNERTCYFISVKNDCTTLPNMIKEQVNQFEIFNYYQNRHEIPLIKPGEMEVITAVKRTERTLKQMITGSLQGNINTIYLDRIQSNTPQGYKIAKGENVHRYYMDGNYMEGKNSQEVIEMSGYNAKQGAVVVSQNITGTTDLHRIHASVAECKKTRIVFLDSVNISCLPNPRTAHFVVGLLNSKLLDWLFRKTSTNNHVNMYELEDLPIAEATPEQEQGIVDRVEAIETLKAIDHDFDTPALEDEIDKIVYELYGLTEVQQAVVEEAYTAQAKAKTKKK